MDTGGLRMAHLAEFQRIRRADPDGLLKPESVVEAASAKRNPLHALFEWDDAKAGHEHRLWQARTYIKTFVVFHPVRAAAPTAVYCSLPEDRARPGGGYRTTASVLSDEDLRRSLVRSALRDLESWGRRYAMLDEFRQAFRMIERLRRALDARDAA